MFDLPIFDWVIYFNNWYAKLYIWFVGRCEKHSHICMFKVNSDNKCGNQYISGKLCKVLILSTSSEWTLILSQIASFMGPTWGPSGSCQPQMVPTDDTLKLHLQVPKFQMTWQRWEGTSIVVPVIATIYIMPHLHKLRPINAQAITISAYSHHMPWMPINDHQ